MTTIAIVTDSSSDLPQDLIAKYDITVVPVVVRFDGETYFDNELSREEFWRRVERTPPHTSGPPLGVFIAAFQKLVERGAHVLCLTLTSRHSNVFSSAWSAAKEFGDRVTVCDSQSISWGIGWQVIAAAEAAAKGLPLEQILQVVQNVRSRVSIQLVLDTVSFVRRGGRADHFIGVIDKAARTLNIKPIITFTAGEMKLVSLSRTWERGVRRIMSEFVQKAPLEALAVGHTLRRERAEQVADELASETGFPRAQIRIFEPGVVISAHSGPGMLAVAALPRA
ncbi:MAG: DegV family protein [Anaerolineae bacterium]